jgi:hypothetical protein
LLRGSSSCEPSFAEVLRLTPPLDVSMKGVDLGLRVTDVVLQLPVPLDLGQVGPAVEGSNSLPKLMVLRIVAIEKVAEPVGQRLKRGAAVIGGAKIDVSDGGEVQGPLVLAVAGDAAIVHELDPLGWGGETTQAGNGDGEGGEAVTIVDVPRRGLLEDVHVVLEALFEPLDLTGEPGLIGAMHRVVPLDGSDKPFCDSS